MDYTLDGLELLGLYTTHSSNWAVIGKYMH